MSQIGEEGKYMLFEMVSPGDLFCGFVSAVVLGLVWSRIQKAGGSIGQRLIELWTPFPMQSQPKMTAASIVRKSIISMFACLFWILILVATLALIIWAFPFLRVSLV
jgi:hypothetical protein